MDRGVKKFIEGPSRGPPFGSLLIKTAAGSLGALEGTLWNQWTEESAELKWGFNAFFQAVQFWSDLSCCIEVLLPPRYDLLKDF